jgi:hypothetical protein
MGDCLDFGGMALNAFISFGPRRKRTKRDVPILLLQKNNVFHFVAQMLKMVDDNKQKKNKICINIFKFISIHNPLKIAIISSLN